MNARRLQLGFSWDELAERAGLTSAGLRAIRSGRNYGRELTRRKLDGALGWEPGTLDGISQGTIEPGEAREVVRTPPDDDAPLTRGEFRLYVEMAQDPDAELSDEAVKKLRALGVDPDRWKAKKRRTH